MITSVRFPTPITLVKNGNPHTEWAPGKDGVKEIDMNNACSVFFELDNGNDCVVVAPPGTVIERRHPINMVANGPASSPPSADPPPARPIRKGR